MADDNRRVNIINEVQGYNVVNQALGVAEQDNPDGAAAAAALAPVSAPAPSNGRQPQNLQQVLRYSIAASTNSTNAPVPPMDTERRAFLEASLRSFAHSAVDQMSACIKVLVSEDTRNDQAACEDALEQIIDLVDNMDNASDFHKIGGFRVLQPGLHSIHESIRSLTAALIAELSQNNPYVQDRVLETNLLPHLLDMVHNDADTNVQVKAFYAVSCVVRDHEPGLQEFTAQSGLNVLLKALQSPVDKLQLKACFLLSSIASRHPATIAELCELGCVERVCELLAAGESQPALSENLLRALLSMVANDTQAIDVCSTPRLKLRRTLTSVLETGDQQTDEYGYAQQIKYIVFGNSYEDDGER